MASRQPNAVINLVLFCSLGGAGWFAGTWLKPAKVEKASTSEVASSGPAWQSGVLLADAKQTLHAPTAGAAEFDAFVTRYGSGSPELEMLGSGIFEKWAAADPAGALKDALPRCLNHTPDVTPVLLARLASVPSIPAPELYKSVPGAPLREPCLTAIASSRGKAGLEPGLSEAAGTFSRSEVSLMLREWYRARALVDAGAADQAAAALKDADDREAARAGILYAKAAASPEATLTASLTRFDFESVAEAAFEAWIPRDSPAAWAYAATLKGDPRLPVIAARMLKVENRQRRFSDSVPEMGSLLERLFPDGLPVEVLAAYIPALAREQPSTAQKFADTFRGPNAGAATVILFDALCETDPAAAWRLASFLVQKEGATDHRAGNKWTSGIARNLATPAERLEKGFPDLTDMVELATRWLAVDPPAAILAYCSPVVPGAVQKVVIQTAVSTHATGIAPAQLMEWARKTQPENIAHTIEGVTGPVEEKKEK